MPGLLRTTAALAGLAPAQNPTTGVVASPFQFYVDEADALRVECYNAVSGVVVALQARFLKDDGAIVPQRYELTPTSDRLVTRKDFALTRGAFLNVSAYVDQGAPIVGQTFVRVRLIRGLLGATIPVGTLLQGYVTAGQDLAYPGSPIRLSTEAAAPVRVIVGTDPAAGAAVLETVPTGAVWELVGFQAQLVTDATVGSRFVVLQLSMPGQAYVLAQCSGSLGAATSKRFCWFQNGLGYDALAGFQAFNGALPSGFCLPAGGQIFTSVTGGGAADDWGAPILCVREQLVID